MEAQVRGQVGAKMFESKYERELEAEFCAFSLSDHNCGRIMSGDKGQGLIAVAEEL